MNTILIKTIKRRVARTLLLKKDDAFEELLLSLKNAYTRAWKEESKKAIAAALDRMRDLKDGKYTKDDGDLILQILENRIGAEGMQAVLKGPIMDLSEPLFKLGATEAGQSAGVDIVFQKPDLDALAIIEKGNMFWVGQHWNSFTHDKFHSALKKYFTEGLTRDQLAARMAEDFGSLSEKGQHYWYLLADHTATKTRELGRVTGYERAGIQYTRIRAHLDDKTTKICRRLHNKIVSVKNMKSQRDKYLKAISEMDAEKAKEVWPMMKDSQAEKILEEKFTDRSPDNLPVNVGMPPYHFLCRTITVVEFDYNQTKPAQEKPEQTKPAHEKPEQPEWKIIPDSQLGTNPGAKVYSPDGKLHYAKFYDNPEQARHEHLANLLLEKLGVGVLDTQLIDLEFKEKKRLAIVSKWIDATPLKKLKDKPFTKTDKDQLTRQFLGAVLTGNRDIVGFDYDNLAKKGKSWYCIDQGGTFQFRAQGGNKSYEANAPEFESILKPGRKAGSVFNPILDDTLKKSPDTYSRWLKTLNRKTISEAVKSAGIDNEDLIDTIALRIDTIGKKINAYSKPKVTEKQHKRKHINEKLVARHSR